MRKANRAPRSVSADTPALGRQRQPQAPPAARCLRAAPRRCARAVPVRGDRAHPRELRSPAHPDLLPNDPRLGGAACVRDAAFGAPSHPGARLVHNDLRERGRRSGARRPGPRRRRRVLRRANARASRSGPVHRHVQAAVALPEPGIPNRHQRRSARIASPGGGKIARGSGAAPLHRPGHPPASDRVRPTPTPPRRRSV